MELLKNPKQLLKIALELPLINYAFYLSAVSFALHAAKYIKLHPIPSLYPDSLGDGTILFGIVFVIIRHFYLKYTFCLNEKLTYLNFKPRRLFNQFIDINKYINLLAGITFLFISASPFLYFKDFFKDKDSLLLVLDDIRFLVLILVITKWIPKPESPSIV
jgi:hypothetical protein